jgi:hypothetical protein
MQYTHVCEAEHVNANCARFVLKNSKARTTETNVLPVLGINDCKKGKLRQQDYSQEHAFGQSYLFNLHNKICGHVAHKELEYTISNSFAKL